MAPEGNDDRLLVHGEHGGFCFPGAGWKVVRGTAVSPFGDGFLIDAVAGGQGSQALLTMLYRSTDCRRRRGAAVQNLSHSASGSVVNFVFWLVMMGKKENAHASSQSTTDF